MPNKDKNIPKRRFKAFENADAWEERKFKDIIEKLTGGASIKPSDYLEEGIRTIPKGAVNSTGLADLSGSKYISEEFYESNKSSHVSTNNLVTSLRDLVPSAPNMGRIVRIAGEDEDFLMPQGVYKLELFDGMDEEFLIAFSNSDKYRKIISSEKNGSTQVHIRNGEFLNIDIELPFSEEQKQIGSFFKQLDNSIALHQRKLDKLKSVKQAYLSEMFPAEGERVPKRRFPGFTDDWELRRIFEIADRFDNLRIPIASSLRVPGRTPYYGANGIQDYVEGYTHDGEFVLVAEDGANDLKNYPVNLVNGKIWVNNHAHVLQGKENIANNNFLSYSINRANIEVLLVGGGRAKLNSDVLMDIELEIPSLPEQETIGTFFSTLDQHIALHQRKS